MKNLIFFAITGLFFACSATRGHPNLMNNEEMTSMYRINKIKNEKSFYIIYAVRNDSTFKIISDTSGVKTGCENIKVGKAYVLDLKIIFPSDSLFGKPVAPNLGLRGYNTNTGKIIEVEEKSHRKIYTALNLTGLCLK